MISICCIPPKRGSSPPPSIVSFSPLPTAPPSAAETPAVPYSPKEHPPLSLQQADTVAERSHQAPTSTAPSPNTSELLAASSAPMDVVGDTLLRQQSFLTITSAPCIIARRKEGLGDIPTPETAWLPRRRARRPGRAAARKTTRTANGHGRRGVISTLTVDEDVEVTNVELTRLLKNIGRVQRVLIRAPGGRQIRPQIRPRHRRQTLIFLCEKTMP